MAKYSIEVNGKEGFEIDEVTLTSVDQQRLNEDNYHVIDGLASYNAVIESIDIAGKSVRLTLNGKTHHCKINEEIDLLLKSLNLTARDKKVSKDLISSMPGLVLSILVEEGQAISKGDPLMILEAMKMENVLKAGEDGTIAKIHCTESDAVEKKQLLIEIV